MDELLFVRPSKKLKAQAEEYRLEHLENGESVLHGGALLDKLPYDEWLESVKSNADEKTVTPGWVVSSTFFAVRKKDGRIVGMLDIRHTLNEFLRSFGGHIGYGVRPSERRKGYAAQMLRHGLSRCRDMGLEKVMLSCYGDNLASRKTIVGCGGILEKEFLHSDGRVVQVFWITL